MEHIDVIPVVVPRMRLSRCRFDVDGSSNPEHVCKSSLANGEHEQFKTRDGAPKTDFGFGMKLHSNKNNNNNKWSALCVVEHPEVGRNCIWQRSMSRYLHLDLSPQVATNLPTYLPRYVFKTSVASTATWKYELSRTTPGKKCDVQASILRPGWIVPRTFVHLDVEIPV